MLRLTYITNSPEMAKLADQSGIDRIMVDLESRGKSARQNGWRTPVSDHNIEDIPHVCNAVKNAEVMVRINSVYEGIVEEIEKVLSYNPDTIMLPYFKSAEEVKFVINAINGRSKICLLIETKEAVDNIDEILSLEGIDEIHIGLNDLSHSYNQRFLFEPMALGIVDYIVKKAKDYNIKDYGIGGIAKIGCGLIPAEDIIGEHYRLGSNHVMLSRTFYDNSIPSDIEETRKLFIQQVKEIREVEKAKLELDSEARECCRKSFVRKVEDIVKGIE